MKTNSKGKTNFKILLTVFWGAFCIYGCSKQKGLSLQQNSALELYTMEPDGLAKINLLDGYITYQDTDCINTLQEIEVIKKVKDDKIQKYISELVEFPKPRDTCDSYRILNTYQSSSIKNLTHFILNYQPKSTRKEKQEKKFVYSIQVNTLNCNLTRYLVDEINVDSLDMIFSNVFQSTYFTKSQLSNMDHLKDIQQADSTVFMNLINQVKQDAPHYSEKLEYSKKLKLISMYASLESFEMMKNALTKLGYSPFITSRVLNELPTKFNTKK